MLCYAKFDFIKITLRLVLFFLPQTWHVSWKYIWIKINKFKYQCYLQSSPRASVTRSVMSSSRQTCFLIVLVFLFFSPLFFQFSSFLVSRPKWRDSAIALVTLLESSSMTALMETPSLDPTSKMWCWDSSRAFFLILMWRTALGKNDEYSRKQIKTNSMDCSSFVDFCFV